MQASLGRAEETYLSVGNAEVGLGGKITLRDSIGPFGNPTSDSRRCAVTPATTDLMLAIYGWGEMEDFGDFVSATEREFRKFFRFREIEKWQEN